jgi:peptidyl-tRNA hydrolase, PTH1 family
VVLVVGLGNPGPQYAGNRHNVGFMVAERLREKLGGAGAFREKFAGELAKGSLGTRGDSELVVLRPLTFMNLSGRSVQRAAAFFQVAVQDVLVVHDDLDLGWQTVRVKVGGGSGGHNGLKSITESLGSPDYVRIRVGIGRPAHGSSESWVLSDFSSTEQSELTGVVDRGVRAIETVLERGVERAMNEFNTKPKQPQSDQES